MDERGSNGKPDAPVVRADCIGESNGTQRDVASLHNFIQRKSYKS